MRTADKAGLVLGFGMGGMMDLLLLHLILQWHHMISNRLPPTSLEALRRNIFWDGVGQFAMWIVILIAALMLLSAAQRRDPMPTMLRFLGLFLIGWGLFNLVDGVLNHHVLALHNVREDVANQMAWNIGWMIGAGIILPLIGFWMAKRGEPRTTQLGASWRNRHR